MVIDLLDGFMETALTGTSREQVKIDGFTSAEAAVHYHCGHGYRLGDSADFDPEFAVDRRIFLHFLETTQKDELAKIKDRPNWQRVLLERLSRKIKKRVSSRLSKAAFALMTHISPFCTVGPTMTSTLK